MWRTKYGDLNRLMTKVVAFRSTEKSSPGILCSVIFSARQRSLSGLCTNWSKVCCTFASSNLRRSSQFTGPMSSVKTPANDGEDTDGGRARKRLRRGSSSAVKYSADGDVTIKSGVFWDIENIPVKICHAERKIPEIKQALTNFVTKINHFDEDPPSAKTIDKFIAVARQRGENAMATTAEPVKQHLIHNQIELLDLPYRPDPDYCDDAIFHNVLDFTQQHDRSMVVALTGDVGLVRRINSIDKDFDLIVVMQRAGKRTTIMQRHCDKIKQTNERGRQQAVYFWDEVVRKCVDGGVPLTFSQLLRLKRTKSEEVELDDDHFGGLFDEIEWDGEDGDDDSGYESEGEFSDWESDTDDDDDDSSRRSTSRSTSSEDGLFTEVDM